MISEPKSAFILRYFLAIHSLQSDPFRPAIRDPQCTKFFEHARVSFKTLQTGMSEHGEEGSKLESVRVCVCVWRARACVSFVVQTTRDSKRRKKIPLLSYGLDIHPSSTPTTHKWRDTHTHTHTWVRRHTHTHFLRFAKSRDASLRCDILLQPTM